MNVLAWWLFVFIFFKKEQCLFQIRSFDPWGNVVQYCHLPSYSYLKYKSVEDLVVPQDQYCGKDTKAKNIGFIFSSGIITIIVFSSTWSFKLQCPHCKGPKKLSSVTFSHSAPLHVVKRDAVKSIKVLLAWR